MIFIDGKQYKISPILLKTAHIRAIDEYMLMDEGIRFGAKAIAREVLKRMESSVRKKTGKEENALLFRPDKKQDAFLFLVEKIFSFIEATLENAEFTFQTEDDGTITGIQRSKTED